MHKVLYFAPERESSDCSLFEKPNDIKSDDNLTFLTNCSTPSGLGLYPTLVRGLHPRLLKFHHFVALKIRS
jgi:hypothetical protein